MIFNKEKSTADTPLLSLLSNEKLGEFLDSFSWTYDEFFHADFITTEMIQEKSIIIASIIEKVNKMKLGESSYTKNGHLIYRRNKNLPNRKKTIQKTFTVRSAV